MLVTPLLYRCINLPPSLSHCLSLFFSPSHTLRRESANMRDDCPIKPCVEWGVLGYIRHLCLLLCLWEKHIQLKQLRLYIHIHVCTQAKLLCLTSVTSFYQTWHVKVAIQFVSVWWDEIEKKGVKGQRLYKPVVKMILYMSKWDAFSLLIWVYKLSKLSVPLCRIRRSRRTVWEAVTEWVRWEINKAENETVKKW